MRALLSDSVAMVRYAPHVWRLELLWQGTVLDVVTLPMARKGRSARLTLRTGETLRARTTAEGELIVDSGDEPIVLAAGVVLELPGGHSIVATEDLPAAHAGRLAGFDSTFFHATMIGLAVQTCVVALLILSPSSRFDTEAGAGTVGTYPRLLIAPGGTAPQRGAPSLSAIGRPPHEGERRELVSTPGTPPPVRGAQQHSLQQALDDVRRMLRLGSGGVEMREAVGELVKPPAAAPERGAGVGGLSPRDPARDGAGNGLVGPGTSRMDALLDKRMQDLESKSRQTLPPHVDQQIIPVELVDIPEAHVTLAAGEQLDPLVKEQLMKLMRERHNAVRHCYEGWGLSADPGRAGRLILELTLRPDGAVENPVVTVDPSGLRRVGECVQEAAQEWRLGDGLVAAGTRLSFPFTLQPRRNISAHRTE